VGACSSALTSGRNAGRTSKTLARGSAPSVRGNPPPPPVLWTGRKTSASHTCSEGNGPPMHQIVFRACTHIHDVCSRQHHHRAPTTVLVLVRKGHQAACTHINHRVLVLARCYTACRQPVSRISADERGASRWAAGLVVVGVCEQGVPEHGVRVWKRRRRRHVQDTRLVERYAHVLPCAGRWPLFACAVCVPCCALQQGVFQCARMRGLFAPLQCIWLVPPLPSTAVTKRTARGRPNARQCADLMLATSVGVHRPFAQSLSYAFGVHFSMYAPFG
jgi:hypothetical protein